MLQRHQVTYIVVGGVGRVLQGADEITRGVDIVPSTKGGTSSVSMPRSET